MATVARKITRQKWTPRGTRPFQRVPLDGVTYDMRTENHALSMWACDLDREDSVNEIALVLAASRDTIDRLDIVFIEESDLHNRGIKVEPTSGNTAIDHLKTRHRDAAELNLQRYCALARLLNDAISKDRCRRFTRQQIRDILAEAVGKKLLALDSLRDRMRAEIKTYLASS